MLNVVIIGMVYHPFSFRLDSYSTENGKMETANDSIRATKIIIMIIIDISLL